MPNTITVLRILVASPSDLDEERKLLEGVIRELNLTWLHQRQISLELIKWETHTFPSAGSDPQDVINKQLPTDYDILLVMFWSRIGTPTPRSKSGTLEEFETAYHRWLHNPNSICLMVYFKTVPISPYDIDPDQIKLIKEFRNSLSEKGILCSTFTGGEEFSQLLRIHLSQQIQDFLKKNKILNVPIDVPIALTVPTKSQIDKSIESDEEEGFLDLIEIITNSFQTASEVTKHYTDALLKLNEGTNQNTLDLKSIDKEDTNKLAVYKRIMNKQAENMADFVAQIRPEIPILDDSLSKALDASGRVLSILPDFRSNSEDYSQIVNTLSSAAKLKTTMITSKESTERFRSIVSAQPRVTTQFNRSKRDLLNILDSFHAICNRGINLLGEIEVTGENILNS